MRRGPEETYSPEDDMNQRIDAQLIVRKADQPRVGRMMELFAEGYTQEEIADIFGITQVRVGQLLNKEFERVKQRKRKMK